MADVCQVIFAHKGYKFWRNSETGLWNVTDINNHIPPNCAYATPKAIADLKGIDLMDVIGFTV